MTRQILLWHRCCQIWTGPTPSTMLLVYTLNHGTMLEHTFVLRVRFQLIFKNVRRNKKAYTNCKSEKNTRGRFRTP